MCEYFKGDTSAKMGRLALYATLALFVAVDLAMATLIASSEVEKCIEDGSVSDPDSVLQECDNKIVVALSVPSSQVLGNITHNYPTCLI